MCIGAVNNAALYLCRLIECKTSAKTIQIDKKNQQIKYLALYDMDMLNDYVILVVEKKL